MYTKRALFFGGTALSGLILTGCSKSSTPMTPGEVASADLALLDQALPAIQSMLAALPPGQRPSDAVLAKIQEQINNFHNNLPALQATTVPAGTIQQIGSVLSAIAVLATPFFPAAGGLIGLAVNAAITLWPVIAQLLNPAVPPTAGITAVPRVRMSAERARATLKAVATP